MTSARGSRILVVDDDVHVLDFLRESLDAAGYRTDCTASAEEALRLVRQREYDLLLADVEMPGMKGTELLDVIHNEMATQLVLLMTAFGSIESAVSAVRAGACDFITKPFRIEALLLAIERALRERHMRREIVRLRAMERPDTPGDIVARSIGMQRALVAADRVAASDATVLLTGETGTGKGVVARYIHRKSARRDGPFFELNCAAVPSARIESELFGPEPEGADQYGRDRTGLLAAAGHGTLFIDEIGELTIDLQVKVLRVLETGRIRPPGSSSDVPVYARIIAATNRPLDTMVRAGEFRPDLFYRLRVIRIELPPLRERREDILPLVDVMLHDASARHDRPVLGVSASAVRRLLRHRWPGNVRELANVIERAVAFGDHDTILPEDLDLGGEGSPIGSILAEGTTRLAPLEEIERAYIRQVIDAHGGNKAAAARTLQIDRRTLYRKIEG